MKKLRTKKYFHKLSAVAHNSILSICPTAEVRFTGTKSHLTWNVQSMIRRKNPCRGIYPSLFLPTTGATAFFHMPKFFYTGYRYQPATKFTTTQLLLRRKKKTDLDSEATGAETKGYHYHGDKSTAKEVKK